MSMQNFEENRSKTIQVRVRKRNSDGRTNGHSNGSEGITSCVAGYKKTVIYRRILIGKNVNIGAALAQSIMLLPCVTGLMV